MDRDARRAQRRQEIWLKYQAMKATWHCGRCGMSDPAVLACHHRHPEDKRETVAGMVARGRSFAAILREVAACDILCHNCHAILHAEMRAAAEFAPRAHGVDKWEDRCDRDT